MDEIVVCPEARFDFVVQKPKDKKQPLGRHYFTDILSDN